MTEYIYRREKLLPGETVDIPDSARDIDYQHGDEETIVCWLEKKSHSVL